MEYPLDMTKLNNKSPLDFSNFKKGDGEKTAAASAGVPAPIPDEGKLFLPQAAADGDSKGQPEAAEKKDEQGQATVVATKDMQLGKQCEAGEAKHDQPEVDKQPEAKKPLEAAALPEAADDDTKGPANVAAAEAAEVEDGDPNKFYDSVLRSGDRIQVKFRKDRQRLLSLVVGKKQVAQIVLKETLPEMQKQEMLDGADILVRVAKEIEAGTCEVDGAKALRDKLRGGTPCRKRPAAAPATSAPTTPKAGDPPAPASSSSPVKPKKMLRQRQSSPKVLFGMEMTSLDDDVAALRGLPDRGLFDP